MAALSGPQDRLFSQVQQLERVVRDKQAEASVAAKQVGASEVGGGEHQFGLGHFRQHVGSYFWAEPSDVLSSLHGCQTCGARLPPANTPSCAPSGLRRSGWEGRGAAGGAK